MHGSELLTRDEATVVVAGAGLALVGACSGREVRTVRLLLEGRVTRASLTAAEYRAVTRWRWAVRAAAAAGHDEVVAGQVEGLVSMAEHDWAHRERSRRRPVRRRCVA